MSAQRAVHELLVTRDGYDELSAELEALRIDGRRAIKERLQEARADGHLDDNPALFDALEEQVQLERRIAVLEARLAAARIAEPTGDGRAGVGSCVQLRDLETGEVVEYELVGAIEGNVAEGRLSIEAPVGRAVLGSAAGDVVGVSSPRGEIRFEVMSVTATEGRVRARKAA
ncbi:MAG: GreA/GreB family elongation factor [Actinomycetota bacterium]|nr:GreA/GreB family elongation factor [Actinomycetota bacterium]